MNVLSLGFVVLETINQNLSPRIEYFREIQLMVNYKLIAVGDCQGSCRMNLLS